MAASTDLKYRERAGDAYGYPALAGVVIYGRAVVGVTLALAAVPAGHADAVALIGFAEERVDNSAGATGDQIVRIKKGVYNVALADADAADINAPVYCTDDNTFTLSDGAGANLQIGTLHAIDADGVWVKTL